MDSSPHYVIIGNGMAGNAAAATLRARDADARVTIISAGALLFYNRYDLKKVFNGCDSWVDLLVHPPRYYEEQRITLRRKSLVDDVDSKRQAVLLAHREEVHYDQLLVATGGGDTGPALFYTALEVKPEKLAAATSRIFLGLQIDCAE